MIKGKFLYLGIIILLAFSLILTGCDNSLLDIGGSGSGELGGQITYDGGVEGVQVVILNETPETVSSYDDLSIVEETIINNADGTYLFDGLSSGTYYVAAYKDENKSGKLEFNDSGIPVEPANIYSEGEQPAPVEVNDDTVTGIDIDLSYEEGTYPQYTVDINVGDPIAGTPLGGASVILRGKSGEQVEIRETYSSGDPEGTEGKCTFSGIFDGEYYLEVTTEDDHRGVILPYYWLRDIDTDADMSVSFIVPMFTETFIGNAFGTDAEDELLLGIIPSEVINGGETTVTLAPSVSDSDIAYDYNTTENGFTFVGNYESPSSFPESPTDFYGYLLGIKNISASIDECELSLSGETGVITFRVKSDRLIIALDQSEEQTVQ